MNAKLKTALKGMMLAAGVMGLQACFSHSYYDGSPYGYGYGSSYGYGGPEYAYGPTYYEPAPTYYSEPGYFWNRAAESRHEEHEEHEALERQRAIAANHAWQEAHESHPYIGHGHRDRDVHDHDHDHD